MPTPLSQRFEAALVFANRLHATQTRKGTRIPYVSHLLGVAGLALEHGADEDVAIGALSSRRGGGSGREADPRADSPAIRRPRRGNSRGMQRRGHRPEARVADPERALPSPSRGGTRRRAAGLSLRQAPQRPRDPR